MSVDSVGIAGISSFSGWIKTGFSIVSPGISSISVSTGFVGKLGISETVGF
jgi:hypothetical protein